MPTGIALRDGALDVIAIDEWLRRDNAWPRWDNLDGPVVVYDDVPPYLAHGWKIPAAAMSGAFYVPLGPPFNIGIPQAAVSRVRCVDPKTGRAEAVALGVCNSVGDEIDPRTGDTHRERA